MRVFFEPGLRLEAKHLKATAQQYFALEADLKEATRDDYFFLNTLGGYEIMEDAGAEFETVLTARDLHTKQATSLDDDYCFGYMADSGLTYLSVARLRGESDAPQKELSVPDSRYKARISFVLVHELGHWFVKDQRHYRKYTFIDSVTGHQQDNGWHCTVPGCVMNAVDDLTALDARASAVISFCSQCQTSLRVVSGMPTLPV